MRPIAAILLVSIALAGCQSVPPAKPAAEPPLYVTAVCGECHAVVSDAISPNPQAPGFADVANSPGLTRETLVTFLSDAHNYPMQMDVDLVEEDIELIADYMITLQGEDYVKPPS